MIKTKFNIHNAIDRGNCIPKKKIADIDELKEVSNCNECKQNGFCKFWMSVREQCHEFHLNKEEETFRQLVII